MERQQVNQLVWTGVLCRNFKCQRIVDGHSSGHRRLCSACSDKTVQETPDELSTIQTSPRPKCDSQCQTERAADWFATQHYRDIVEMRLWCAMYVAVGGPGVTTEHAARSGDVAVTEFRKRYPCTETQGVPSSAGGRKDTA